MTHKDERGVSGLLSVFLRLSCGMTQLGFGKASRVDQSEISRFELGTRVPSEEILRRLATTAGVPWPSVVHLRRVYEAILGKPDRPGTGSDEGGAGIGDAILEEALLAMSPCLIELGEAGAGEPAPESAREEAREVWAALAPLAMEERRRLLAFSRRAAGSWALAEEIREAGKAMAAENPEEALALAGLAVEVAGPTASSGGAAS